MTRGAELRARGLGWFSVGLGLSQIAAPRALLRLIGIRERRRNRALMRARGVRELGAGIGILARRRRPRAWLWARVAGDAIDVALLGAALRSRRRGRWRIAGGLLAIGGVTALDVLTGHQLGRTRRSTRTITVDRAPDEVARLWRDSSPTDAGEARFVNAPGGRGTEIHVELACAGWRARKRVADDLRRFKQMVETGEVAR